jgi:ribosomal protein S18 acetylase RimI-like enzyme
VTLSIRQFDEADAAAVMRLHHEALGPTGAHLGPGPWDDDLEKIREVYLDAGGEFLVATLDDRSIVAMGALRRVDGAIAEIKRMRTAPALQGRGYGRRILARLEARAEELGYTRLQLDTTVKQVAARHLYQTAGYTETRRSPGPGADENIIYEKSMKPE